MLYLKDNFLIFEDDVSKFEINKIENEELFQISESIIGWKLLPNDFYEGIQKGLFGTNNQINYDYPFINTLFFKNEKVLSMDNMRISEYKFDSMIEDSFNLSSNISILLLKIKDIKWYKVIENKVFFKTSDNFIICCLFNEIKYPPEYNNFLNFDKDIIQINFGKHILESIDLCSILNNDLQENDQKVKIDVCKSYLICSSQTDKGRISYTVNLQKQYEEEFSFVINPIFLNQVIRDKSFKIFYDNVDNRIYFQDKKYKFVTMTIEEDNE